MSDQRPFAPWVSAEAQRKFEDNAQLPAPPIDLPGQRDYYHAYNQRHLEVAVELFEPVIVAHEIAGVPVYTVTPKGGATRPGVLICLHGGAFMWGSGPGALLEAVPVSAASGMKIIAVNYRLAPEHVFPAAVDDVLAVYKTLLQTDVSSRIGIYGCSAGGILTAQAVSRFLQEGLPPPGAIAMLHGTGLEISGDSVSFARSPDADNDTGAPVVRELPYFEGADLSDPLVLPGNHAAILAQFPPTLLVTGTRDFAASSVSVMHRRLLAEGVSAQCVNFDGMWHAHHMAVDLPESRETFEILARFFAENLD